MTQLTWATERRKLSDLKLSDGNPRTLKKFGRDVLDKSLKKFGLVEIPVINTDGTVIAGHQRVRALIAEHGEGYEIDVRVPSRELTTAEFREYRIRANTHAGEWDFEVLANEYDISELVEFGFGTDELGIDINEPKEKDPKIGVVKLTFEIDAETAIMINARLEDIMMAKGCSKSQALVSLFS